MCMCTPQYTHTRTHICIHTHNGILLSHIKEGKLVIATMWMDLGDVLLSETRQTEKDKSCMTNTHM